MIYLQRQSSSGTPEIAAVEDARSAAPYEAQGYTRCSFEEFREAWRLRDQGVLDRIRAMFRDAAPPRGIYPAAS